MKTHMKNILVAGAAVAAVATTAFATAQAPDAERLPSSAQGVERQFSEMDKNNDGVLSRDEINPELRLYQEFDRFDVDGTGAIELDEFQAYLRAAQDDKR